MSENKVIPMIHSFRLTNLTTDANVKFHGNNYGYWAIFIKEDGTIVL